MGSFYGSSLAELHQQAYEPSLLKAAPRLLRLLRSQGIRGGRVLDLGCGSGGWARELVRHGYEVVGVDISPAMVRLARRRVPRGTFVCGSMTRVPLPPCDAITSFGEGINYLRRPAEVRRLFARAYAALRLGGVFLFDVLQPTRSRRPVERSHSRRTKNWLVFAVTREDPTRGSVVRRISWFRRDGRTYRAGEEEHRQRLYRRAVLMRWLRRAGFRVHVFRGPDYARAMNRWALVLAHRR